MFLKVFRSIDYLVYHNSVFFPKIIILIVIFFFRINLESDLSFTINLRTRKSFKRPFVSDVLRFFCEICFCAFLFFFFSTRKLFINSTLSFYSLIHLFWLRSWNWSFFFFNYIIFRNQCNESIVIVIGDKIHLVKFSL